MKLTVDITDNAWRAQREAQWESIPYYPDGTKRQQQRQRDACRLIFMGDVVDKNDKRVKVLGGDSYHFMYYSPHQCEENWDVWVPENIARLEEENGDTHPLQAIDIFLGGLGGGPAANLG